MTITPKSLSVDAALQQGLAHHQAGHLQEAEQFYRAVLQAQPAQPDTNHNLGLIACQLGQAAAGLPFLKNAFFAYPAHLQYPLTYAEALLAVGNAQEAYLILQYALQRGLPRITSQALLQRVEEALPSGFVPTSKRQTTASSELNNLIGLYQSAQYAMVEIVANELLMRDPQCALAWKILGAALQILGKESSLQAMKTAAQLLPNDAEAHANLGIALRNFGQLQESAANCRLAVKLNPNSAHAQNGLGLTLRDLNQLDDAIACYRRAVKLQPEYVEAICNLGDALRDQGKHEEALINYRKAINKQANYAIAHEHMGDVLRDLGKLEDARASYQQALQLNPDADVACLRLAQTLQSLDQNDAAVATFQRALTIKPESADIYCNLGDLLFQQQRMEEAEPCYRKAIHIEQDNVTARTNLGNLLGKTGKYYEAIDCYLQALAIKPDFAIVHNNLSNALYDIGDYDGAIASARQALVFDANFALAYNNLGNVLWELGKLDEAAYNLRQALRIDPELIAAYSNLGNILLDCRRLDESLASHRQAIARSPDQAKLHNNLLMTMQYDSRFGRADIYSAHREFGEHFEKPLKAQWPRHLNSRVADKRLKIGYVSGDFRKHAVASFIEPVFQHCDKSQIEIFCYSNCAKEDTVTARLKAAADHWHPCYGLTDEHLAQRILSDEIDILVDLAGHTFRNRLPVFAHKPAPIQVTYLGYPSGSGLTAMDYRLTDQYAEPESSVDPADRYYTEKLFRLPDSLWCYQPAEDTPEVTPLPALANGHLTFGSFNNINKIGDECITLWAKLLQSLPTSRLVIATIAEGELRERLTAQFAECGIESSRIAFCGKLPSHEFHRALQEIDISLDPLPINGATTTCESLWLGVPVLTLVGERFLARAGLSVLSAAQLTEFAATTEEEFIAIAKRFANDLPGLAAIRAGLREHLRGSPLLDQKRYTRNLEQAYRTMWHRYLAQ